MSSAADHPVLTPLASALDFVLPEELPNDPGVLKALLQSQQQAVSAEVARQVQAQLEAEVQAQVKIHLAAQAKVFEARLLELYEQIRLMRRRMFGPSSESNAGQGVLFNEAELVADAAPDAQDTADRPLPGNDEPAKSAPTDTKVRGKRQPLPSELPRVEVLHELPEADRTCACGTPMVVISEEVSEQLDIVPMQIRVLRHIRKRYGCPAGEHAPVCAPVPAQVLPKSNASNDLLAMLLTTKYVDGLPLARFESVLARAGAIVPRQTLARWVIGAAGALQPLLNLMRDTLLDGPVIHMDETPVQVLKEAGRAATSQSYMWVQRGGPPGKPVVLFDYDPSRSGQIPLRLLAGWRGYLMTDGYEAYNAVVVREQIDHLACWAHARRHFVDAAKLQVKGKRGRADQAIAFIGQLYRVERTIRDQTDAERFAARQTRSVPVLAELRRWLDESLPRVPPTTALGKALAYLRNAWPRLIRYTERGDLPIDNNAAENSIRPFVVGRKAWLFSDTPAGARASALIYSLIETVKANGLEPYSWLRRVLGRLPLASTLEDYEALLPWKFHATDLTTEAFR